MPGPLHHRLHLVPDLALPALRPLRPGPPAHVLALGQSGQRHRDGSRPLRAGNGRQRRSEYLRSHRESVTVHCSYISLQLHFVTVAFRYSYIALQLTFRYRDISLQLATFHYRGISLQLHFITVTFQFSV